MKPFPALRGAIAIIVIVLGTFPCQATPAAAPAVQTLHRFETVGDLRLARCMNGKGGSAACHEAATQRGVSLGPLLGWLALPLLVLGPLAACTRRHHRWTLHRPPRYAYAGGLRSLCVVQTGAQASAHRAAQTHDEERERLTAQMVA